MARKEFGCERWLGRESMEVQWAVYGGVLAGSGMGARQGVAESGAARWAAYNSVSLLHT